MRKSWSTVAGAARRCAVFIVLPAVAACTAGPAPGPERDGAAREVPRSPYGDGSPDLNGIWQALGSAHWDIEPHVATPGPVLEIGAVGAAPAGLGVVEGGAIPYQEWALERRAENAANRPGGDPEVQCVLPGVPRAMYLPLPFQIIQTPERIMMAFEYANAVRTISLGVSGYEVILVATGALQATFLTRFHFYDIAAAAMVLWAAGGGLYRLSGEPVTPTEMVRKTREHPDAPEEPILACHPAHLEELLRMNFRPLKQ